MRIIHVYIFIYIHISKYMYRKLLGAGRVLLLSVVIQTEQM